MNIIKIETGRILEIKKHMKNIGRNSISPKYINNISKIYNLDEENLRRIVFNNIHNEVTKSCYDKLLCGEKININSMIEQMLEEHEISPESKNKIADIYKPSKELEDNNVISFSEFKTKKLNLNKKFNL